MNILKIKREISKIVTIKSIKNKEVLLDEIKKCLYKESPEFVDDMTLCLEDTIDEINKRGYIDNDDTLLENPIPHKALGDRKNPRESKPFKTFPFPSKEISEVLEKKKKRAKEDLEEEQRRYMEEKGNKKILVIIWTKLTKFFKRTK